MSHTSCSLKIARSKLLRWLLVFLPLLIAAPSFAAGNASDLKLLISVDQQSITEPFPARIRLQLHNAGKEPLWLYTPVRDVSLVSGAINPFTSENLGEGSTTGGSSLEIHLVPTDGSTPEEPASGRVLEIADFPHPQLIEMLPGGDYEEKAFVRLRPATSRQGDEQQPIWGAYKLSVTYRAQYSNGPNLNAILQTHIWQGETRSNRVDVQLRPPAADARASVTGSIINTRSQPIIGFLVTLTDQESEPIDQMFSDENGEFKFSRLPFGFYWVIARPRFPDQDVTVLRHVTPDTSSPEADIQMVLVPLELHHAKQLRHKPALFRVFDSDNRPLAGVNLDDTWSSGTVTDRVRGRTNEGGSAVLQLIPGRNFVTMKMKGCKKQDERVEVAPGTGIDGFRLDLDCGKK